MSLAVWESHHIMLIIAGYLVVDPSERDRYVADCVPVVELARAAPGCLDFAITADSVDPARVRIYERWTEEAHLLAFRGSGLGDEQSAAIIDAEVLRYVIESVGDA